ncbi:4Fe-4S ferredoxin iron-sulfur binding domain protein [Dehalogenimonas lykanthroporepellens BL-DC-9]|nr:4Fe-4S ferredoxin iron-sulfur binding domain protein [Dehalogenimonas lykanthroporepellens BL-DC-9]
MCQFCHQHGEGRKWYLNAANYADELLADIERRRYIAGFFRHPEGLPAGAANLERLHRTPAIVRRMVTPLITARQKRNHFGQVLPLEDVDEVLSMTTSVVRLACICRHSIGKPEARYCYGLSLSPGGGRIKEILDELDDTFLHGPDTAGLEVLTPQEARTAIRRHDEDGMCHTIWTFQTPFIGGICNCDRADCMALNVSLNLETPVLFRAEYVAAIDTDACTGCRACLAVCHFGALAFSHTDSDVRVNNRFCYGCGICRAACPSGAVTLVDRSTSPVAGLW